MLERRFATFYSLFAGDFRDDIPLYIELAAKYPGAILEVGCRAGRITAHIAAAGHEVCAVDTSRPMLEIARQHLRPWEDRVRVADFDLRQGALYEGFHAVFATGYAFNKLIEVEEQRLFLRHVIRSMQTPGVLALDLFCPLSMLRPDAVGEWRRVERRCGEQVVVCRDRRDMLTPLLERRTQVFSIDGGPKTEMVTHRRYVSPQQTKTLLEESGLENVRWVRGYDLSTVGPIAPDDRPRGPFLLLADR